MNGGLLFSAIAQKIIKVISKHSLYLQYNHSDIYFVNKQLQQQQQQMMITILTEIFIIMIMKL